MSARPPALSARLQAVRLQRCPVLGPMQLDIAAGGWTAIVGPNGAGKSTLLRALAGLQPAEGELRLHGRLLGEWTPAARARALAWLGQDEPVGEGLSAQAVVMLGRLPHRAWLAPPSAADLAAVEGAMRETGSWPWRDRSLDTLSGGERQRVLLARALAVGAEVLLMDEPLTHLDPPHQADWLALVAARRDAGATIVSVLHELNLALQADSLVVMRQGRVEHHGPPGDPATREALCAVFDQRLRLVALDGQWIALPGGVAAGS
jgi:iron complex transport system ATP-binding protein